MVFGSYRREVLKIPFPEIYIDPRMAAKAERLCQQMPQIMEDAYKEGVFRFAKQLLAAVRKAMRTGVPPGDAHWDPLADSTLKTYKSWKYNTTNPWHLTGQLLRTVNIFVNNRRGYYVGFPRGVKHVHPHPSKKSQGTKGPLSLSTLSKILEAGTDYRAGRPLFNPAFKAIGGKARLQKFVIRELRKQVRKYTT